jgi:hypothetical protein
MKFLTYRKFFGVVALIVFVFGMPREPETKIAPKNNTLPAYDRMLSYRSIVGASASKPRTKRETNSFRVQEGKALGSPEVRPYQYAASRIDQ